MADIEDCYDALYQNRAPFFFVFGFYVCWMLGIAFTSFLKNQKAAEGDEAYEMFYLGGKSYGSVLLFLTLFSTIFSGYTVIGVPNEASSLGYFAVRWLTSAPWVGLAVLTYSPRGRRLSVARKYLSPNDVTTDRFDNRLLTTLMSLLTTAPQILYIIAQYYTLKNLIPTLSGYGRDGLPLMDGESMTWFLGAVIWICEAVGGFNAVSMTDALQSCLMLVSLILVPIIATYYYNGAGGSTELMCESFEVIDCANDDNTFGIPGFCMPGCGGTSNAIGDTEMTFNNGCLADVAAGHLVLHPATGWSEYGTPYDNSAYMNYTGVNIFSFNILFFAFFLNPHWIQRTYAAKSDTALKKANMVMNFAGYIASLPGLFVGIMVAASLKKVYVENSSNSAFGVLLSDMMNKGGFPEAVAVLASCSAIAAIMSTTDSAIIGVTNVLSRDFLNNWLFRSDFWKGLEAKGWSANRFATVVNKITSLIVTILAISIALYDCKLSARDDQGNFREGCSAKDETEAIYGNLISWQNALLWQALPTATLGIFMERANSWALIIGLAVGMSMMGGMFNHIDSTALFGTQNADTDGAKTYYLQVGGSALWPGFANLFVSTVLSLMMGDMEAPAFFRHGDAVTKQFGEKRLDQATITEIMKDTVEPLSTTQGRVCMAATVILTCLPLPYWGESYDGCTVVSFLKLDGGDGCDGEYTAGIPAWAFTAIACYVAATFTNLGAYMAWKTCDEESNMLAGLVGEAEEKTAEEGTLDQQQIGKPIEIELGERTV